MPSILERALGPQFAKLHPEIRRQYAITSEDGVGWVGRGVMSTIWRGGPHVVPFLRLGALRRVMFPETGENVAFTIWNYAYRDRFGRETLTWIREFALQPVRRFDETLIYSERRGCALVYAGTHQHLAVELEFGVDSSGALRMRTGTQRLYEWRLGIRIPLLVSGRADVIERFDGERGRFEVDVTISNAFVGGIFGYRGWFTLEQFPCRREDIPQDAMPIREEGRE